MNTLDPKKITPRTVEEITAYLRAHSIPVCACGNFHFKFRPGKQFLQPVVGHCKPKGPK